jgi:hypothetical protein
MRYFLRFSLIWYSQQFAIPFWIVGHVHLQLTSYPQVVDLLASFTMHAAVAVGFWLDWVDHRDASKTPVGSTSDCTQDNEREAD